MKKIIEVSELDKILEKLATRPYNQVADIISDLVQLTQESPDYIEEKRDVK